MFLKIPLIRGVTRFGIKGKGAPRCIGPFEIIEKVDDVAYHLNLRLQLGHLDNVFHVFVLKKYMHDPSHILPYTEVPLQADMSYEE